MLCCRAVSQFIALEPENVYMNSGEPAEESNDTAENVYANVWIQNTNNTECLQPTAR